MRRPVAVHASAVHDALQVSEHLTALGRSSGKVTQGPMLVCNLFVERREDVADVVRVQRPSMIPDRQARA